MLTDEQLEADKSKITEDILKIETAINQGQQQLQQMQSQLIRLTGALGYIQDNLKPEEEPKCSEET